MKAVVAGAGKTGRKVAGYLIKEGYNVVLIDTNADTINELTDEESLAGYLGDCKSLADMEKIGISEADLFIATTNSDETNMLSAEIASYFGVLSKIIKVDNINYLNDDWNDFMYQKNRIPIDIVVSPYINLVNNFVNRLAYNYTNLKDIVDFLDSKVSVVSVYIDEESSVIGRTIDDVYNIFSTLNIKIFGVLRKKKFIFANSRFEIKAKDYVYMAIEKENLERIINIFSEENNDNYNFDFNKNLNEKGVITILGTHSMVKYLAMSIAEKYEYNINIVIKDKIKAVKFAVDLQTIYKDKINVITEDIIKNKDGYFFSEGVNDKIIIFGEDDKENIFTGLYCKSREHNNIFCILNDDTNKELAEYYDIGNIYVSEDFILSPIINELKHMNGVTNSYVINNDVEVLEIEIGSKSNLIGKTISKFENTDIEVLAITSKDGVISLKQNDHILIKSGDKIIVAVSLAVLDKLNELLTNKGI